MTILHTADFHLWHKHKYTSIVPGKHWDYFFEAKMDVLEKIKDYVSKNHVDYFIIAGDIFEHHNPIEAVRKEFIKFVLSVSSMVKEIYIMLGNHDQHKGQHSLETAKELLADTKIKIFTTPIIIPVKTKSDIIKIKIDHIGLKGFKANGNYFEKNVKPIKEEVRDSRITLLGHYHSNQYKERAFYSGSPYPIDFGEECEQKYFNIFDIDNDKISFKRVKLNGIIFKTVSDYKELDGDKKYIIRIKKIVPVENEKETRVECFRIRERYLSDKRVLGCVYDVKIDKGIKLKKEVEKKTLENHIKELKIDDKYKEYFNAKLVEARANNG